MDRFHSFLREGSGGESAMDEPKPQTANTQPSSEKIDPAKILPNGIEESSDKNVAKQTDDSKRVEGLKKKKLMRIEKQLAKSKVSKLDPTQVAKIPSNQPKTLLDILPSKNYAALNEAVEQDVGKDSRHKFSLRLVRASMRDQLFRATFEESYMVYKNYQQQIHGDSPSECDMRTFGMFLCDSPLIPREENGVVLGAFHQQYLVDGRIVAVGVIDILPSCLSSVYLYYCPNFWGRHLSPGTYSAIR